MQRRNSVLNTHYFGLLLLGLFISVVSRRIEPLYAVLPLAIALAYSRMTQVAPVVHLQSTITPTQAFEGDLITIGITFIADTQVPPMELWHPLPLGATCTSGHTRVLLTLRPGEERTIEHQVTFSRRGTYTLGRFYSRVHTDTDLQPLMAEYQHDQVCQIYPHVLPLQQYLSPWHTRASFGHTVARNAGDGVEFAGIRPYINGDRIRRINWRTSLKRDKLYVNEYYQEHNADVIMLLDTLVAVGAPQDATTLDIAVRSAASLASYYLQHNDRVGLVQYSGVCTWILPSSGPQQWQRILNSLLTARTHFSYLTKDIALIPPRVLPPGALIFVFTTLIDSRIEAALQDLIARAFQLVLVVISPVQVSIASAEKIKAAERLWHLEMEGRLDSYRRLGVPIILQDTPELLPHISTVLPRGPSWQRAR